MLDVSQNSPKINCLMEVLLSGCLTCLVCLFFTYSIVIRLSMAENVSVVQRHRNGELLLPLAPIPKFYDSIACLWRKYDITYQEMCGKYFKALRNVENDEELLKIQFYSLILSKCQPQLKNQQCQDGRNNGFVYPMELTSDIYKWGTYFYLFALLNHNVLAYKVWVFT